MPEYSTCLTDKGKIAFKALPNTLEITFNDIRVSPSEGRTRTREEAAAFKEWSKLAVLHNKTLTKPRDRNHNSEESRANMQEKRKEKRQSTATEAKSLIWWITFCVNKNTQPRFCGNRQDCFNAVVTLFNVCDHWLQYCQMNDVTDPTRIVSLDNADELASAAEDESEQETDNDEAYDIDAPLTPSSRAHEDAPQYREEYREFHDQYNITESFSEKDVLHWYVVCREGPGDMNFFGKRKKPLDRKLLIATMGYLEIGQEDSDTQFIQFQVVREQKAFSIARYLAFGYCSDNHKTYKDVDPEPLMGSGDIDIPVTHLRTWLQHAIELAGHRKFSDMHYSKKRSDRTGECRAWFTAISCRCNATVRMFEELKMVLLGDADNDNLLGERSTPEIRMRKLHQAALGHEGATREDDITRLFIILAWHQLNPVVFAQCIYQNLFKDRDSKKQILISAPSNGCKSAIFDRIVGPAGSGAILISESINHSSKGGASLRMYASLNANRQADCIVFPEFGKLIRSGQMTQSMALSLLEDSTRAEETYLRGLARLPCVAMNQVPYVKLPDSERDKKSLMNRLEVLEFKGPRVPESHKDRWHISVPVMAQFLLGEIHAPDWFRTVSNMFALLQKNMRQAKEEFPQLQHSVYDPEGHALREAEDTKFYGHVEAYLCHKFPHLWNAANKAACEKLASVNVNMEPDLDEAMDEYRELFGEPPPAKRARMSEGIDFGSL